MAGFNSNLIKSDIDILAVETEKVIAHPFDGVPACAPV
jgi:hypothetical protein